MINCTSFCHTFCLTFCVVWVSLTAASASPFEALAERMNWLKVAPEKDPFGARLIKAGVSKATITAWSVDPQVNGKSLFDQLEDTDSDDCIAKCVAMAPKSKGWFW